MNTPIERQPAVLLKGEIANGRELPRIARASVASALDGRDETPPLYYTGFLSTPHPVFVTIRDDQGRLRGCVGTLSARCHDVVDETWRLAREAAFSDTRFDPVTVGEIGRLSFEVSVVQALEEVEDPGLLDPQHYGVVVSTDDGRRGALLPNIEGVDTVTGQLAIARRKGGIAPVEPAVVQRFAVDRFSDRASRALQ